MNISRILPAAALATAMAGAAMAADTYKTDPGHTEVRFGWSHAGVSMQHGEFTAIDGILVLDQENLEASTLTATIQAASISTGVEALDKHVKTADFLDVETFPQITFESTSVNRTGDKTADISGNLTLHGVTKPVVLQAALTHLGAHPVGQFFDYYKGDWAAFSARAEIDATEFGVGPAMPVGKVFIEIHTELKAAE
jgi:polyisoprenoid-binding protein YceI